MEILFLFLAFYVLQSSAQNFIFPSSPSTFSDFSLYKNSPFSTNCSFDVQIFNKTYDPSIIQTAYARSQSDFCSQLDSTVEWYIIPTNTTPAAFLPNWSSTTIDLATHVVTAVYLVFKFAVTGENEVKLDRSFLLFKFYSICQHIFWWYSTIAGLVNPLHATWINPYGWLVPVGLLSTLTELEDSDQVDCSHRVGGGLLILGFAALWASGVYTGVRVNPGGTFNNFSNNQTTENRLLHLGSGSYTPVDASNAFDITDSCQQVLQDPTSAIYTDPAWSYAAKLHFALWWIAVPLGLLYFFNAMKTRTTFRGWLKLLIAPLLSIILDLVAIIAMALIARRGTPFMYLEECQAVVIAMSPKRGYWDARVDEAKAGYTLQILRSVFGL
ncbi:hypothetical protein GALMADRAFT_1223749 [Galerina marginata CBS 339.88]|uniref:Uncharacterized protein n=1 Tax=Galerina marginata (strain CBS 339.88) TaxID=685588 RepID=A0A067T7G6_GALM3|nr:hypothetical protein GALMADRAFT_1223749 [Galerina marginata CBS 339.88]